MNSLSSKFLYQLAVSFLYSLMPVLVFPYISRVLGPDGIGKISFVDYTAQFFILFASFGLPMYAVREIAKVRQQKEKLQQLCSELLFIHSFFSLLSLAGFGILITQLPEGFREKGLFVLAALNILLNAASLEWLLQGLEDFRFFSKRSFVIKLLSVASVFVFIHNAEDYTLYYLLLVLANLATLLADLVYAYRRGLRLVKPVMVKRHLPHLFIFFLNSVTISLYTYFDTVILGLLAGSLAVGFYTTGLKTIRLTQSFVNDIGGVLLPRVSYLQHEKNIPEMNRLLNLSLQYILTVSVPFALFLYLMAPEIILLLAGPSFLPSATVLRILSVLPLMIGLSNLFGTQVLLSFGKEKKVLAGVLAGSLVSIGMNLALCPVYRQNGAALACIAAEIIVTLLLAWPAAKLIKFIVPFHFWAGLIISSATFIPIVLIIQYAALPTFIALFVAGLSCFGTYFLLQHFFFRNSVIGTVLRFFTRKFVNQKTS